MKYHVTQFSIVQHYMSPFCTYNRTHLALKKDRILTVAYGSSRHPMNRLKERNYYKHMHTHTHTHNITHKHTRAHHHHTNTYRHTNAQHLHINTREPTLTNTHTYRHTHAQHLHINTREPTITNTDTYIHTNFIFIFKENLTAKTIGEYAAIV